ncbi:MAG: MBL fold metallo-hydrolase [Verrucomicrobiae bacterium]|nr:MBL fold metallo-hydrolase [Verrucomicrobiae bacterium]
MKIRIWGTRGSIPTPSAPDFPTRRYGGETTCVSVSSGDALVILDAGSGIRHLGAELLRAGPRSATLLFSHFHWDHIQGFPFFVPAYRDEFSFDIYGPPQAKDAPKANVAQTALEQQHAALFFPVPFCALKAKFKFLHLPSNGPLQIDAGQTRLVIHHAPLNHPGGCNGYRIEEHAGSDPARIFAYVTDNEHPAEGTSPSVQALAKGADIVLMDSQYTEDEYAGKTGGCPKKGWGHSTWKACLRETKEAGAKKLLLTHHDPTHDDSFITLMERGARREGAKQGIAVEAAVQGREYEIG